MKVRLSRLRIKKGKESRVDEWLKMLNDRIGEAVQTLDREQMKIEVIFRERIGEAQFLSWFAVQGEDGQHISTSPFAIDHEHRAFADECIDHDYGSHDAQPQCIFVPDRVARAMEWPDPPAARVAFENREKIHYKPGYTRSEPRP